MGLFSFLCGKSKKITIYAPTDGKVIDLSEVPDEAFSKRMVGDGCAIDPSGTEICSPVDGKLENVFPTKHAILLESKEGLEIIVHFGVDTVKLNGKGFTQLRDEGNVKVGDKMVAYNLSEIKDKVPSIKTPILINNMEFVQEIKVLNLGKNVKIGDPIMEVTIK